jgi:organic radical activating enzyme
MELFNDNQIFDIEITTRCNKQCYICPRENFTRQNRDMSSITFENICNWLPAQSDVFFAGYGEPMLHREYMAFISRLSEEGFRTSIVTNGNLLSYNKICELYEAGLHKLQISILLKYEEIKIKSFVDIIDRKFHNKTQFNLLYDETMEKPEFLVDNLKKMGFKVYYKRIHNRGGELYRNEFEHSKSIPCGTFLNVTYIDTEGSLQICSNDINGKYNLGSIETLTFDEFMDKKREMNKAKEIAPICKLCDDEYRLLNLKKLETRYEQ